MYPRKALISRSDSIDKLARIEVPIPKPNQLDSQYAQLPIRSSKLPIRSSKARARVPSGEEDGPGRVKERGRATNFFPSFSSFANRSKVLLHLANSFSAGWKGDVKVLAVDLIEEDRRAVSGGGVSVDISGPAQ